MKVVVRCAHNRITKSEMEKEVERLFQENKDLRVSESHLRDEIKILRQMVEAGKDIICERDALIQELNDQIAASEAELAEAQTKATQYNDSAFQFGQLFVELQNRAKEAEDKTEEYRIALMESDARVDELNRRVEWQSNEIARKDEMLNACDKRLADRAEEVKKLNQQIAWLETENEQYENTLTIVRTEAMAAKDVAYEEAKRADDLEKTVEGLRETIRNLEQQVEMYRSSADRWHHEHDLMKTANDHLCDQIDDLTTTIQDADNAIDGLMAEKRQFGEEIDRLRKVVVDLQTNRFTMDEFASMCMSFLDRKNNNYPSAESAFNF